MLHVTVVRPRRRTLCFDLETLAAGYADPAWVPDKITVAAWSWLDDDEVCSLSTGKDGFWSRKIRGERLQPLVEALRSCDMAVGHNVLRFDCPVLQAELIRCGQPPLGPLLVHDTIRLLKTKGLKKGQDDLSVMSGSPYAKETKNWSEWDVAYEDDGWPEVISRCKTDVQQNKWLYQELHDRGLLKPARMWRP